jgi:hypothetical protein
MKMARLTLKTEGQYFVG